jgi:hypothetical protein
MKQKIKHRRHYCTNCGSKKQERFMKPVEVSKNNRMAWQCIICNEEHRRYGRQWPSKDKRYA